MPKFHSLEQPNQPKKETLQKELKGMEIKPRLTFVCPLGENRRDAFEMISGEKQPTPDEVLKLLRSDDFVEQFSGIYLTQKINISKLPSNAIDQFINRLDEISASDDPKSMHHVRTGAIKALGNCGERALQLIQKYSESKEENQRKMAAHAAAIIGEKGLSIVQRLACEESPFVRAEAVKAAIRYGDKGLEIIDKRIDDPSFFVRSSVTQVLGEYGKDGFERLKQLLYDKDSDVQRQVAESLGKSKMEGDRAILLLEEMRTRTTDPYALESIAIALYRLGENEKALLLFEELTNITNPYVKRDAELFLKYIYGEEKNFSKWLLATRKPLFATPFLHELGDKIKTLEKIKDELRDECGSAFVGFVVVGSTAKGYAHPESDIDWALFAEKRSIEERLKEKADQYGIEFCKHAGHYNDACNIEEGGEALFYGLFFGDRERLKKLQKDFISHCTDEQWEKIRINIMLEETKITKAVDRYMNISEEEEEKIKHAIGVLRTPPPLAEMKEILKQRTRNL